MNEIIIQDLDFIVNSDIGRERLKNKTVLITGAYGMLLSYMTFAMLRLNELDPKFNLKIIALVRNKEKAKKIFGLYTKNKNLKLFVHDLSSPIKLSEKIDYIIHGASYASPRYFRSDPVAVITPNVIGTHYLLELAKSKKIRGFLYFSSGAVYGRADTEVVKETEYGRLDPLDIMNCYGESKRMAENMCASWYYQFGIPTKIVRPAHVYGPTMDIKKDNRVFASFMNNVIGGKQIVMKSDGTAKRSFCYIADATVAFLKVLLDGVSGEAYNIGNDKEYMSIKKLIQTIVTTFPERRIKVKILNKKIKNGAKRGAEKMLMSSKKAEALGWKCAFSLCEGLKRTVNSFSNK